MILLCLETYITDMLILNENIGVENPENDCVFPY